MIPRIVNFIIFLVLSLSLACGITGSTVPPPCPIENLMIDQALFSEDWHQPEPPREKSASLRWGVEKLGVGFISMTHGVAIQDVYRGRNVERTETEYFNRITVWFHPREDETDWYIPSDFNYESPIADRYRFGCQTHKPSEVENCQLVGQYGVYLTRFHTFMSPIMTYEDLERILQAIDNKMAQCLGK